MALTDLLDTSVLTRCAGTPLVLKYVWLNMSAIKA